MAAGSVKKLVRSTAVHFFLIKSTDRSLALPLWAAVEQPEQYPFIILIFVIKNELETNALIEQGARYQCRFCWCTGTVDYAPNWSQVGFRWSAETDRFKACPVVTYW